MAASGFSGPSDRPGVLATFNHGPGFLRLVTED